MSIQAASLYGTVTIAGAETSVGQLQRVSNQADKTQASLKRFSGVGTQIGRGAAQVAGGIVKIGTVAAVAALTAAGAAAKIAASFEDAFAAVRKTVEGTPAQLDQIDKALRRLTTTIPVTFGGLATIASEAGALGVATKDIAKFTEAVARTSAAVVGLDPFAASEAFGKLSTIFGLTGDRLDATTGKMVSDYDRLGSALVALGNAGASSEADIIAVTKRFAAAGHIAGLTAAEILGWSSALASLGPEAEAAGGALQRLFNRAARNIGLVDVPGAVGKNARQRVKTFAAVTGLTVDEFVALYTKDASAAMQRFIQGLQGMDQFQSAKALFQAGVINQRDILAIQSFSSRYEVLNKQLAISNDAWKQGTALQTVSEKRFDTLKSKAIEFKNQVLLGAAAVGDGMLPALSRLADKGKAFVALHMGDLATLGRNIGAAIDRIDWTEVQKGAEEFVGILRSGYDLISKIPVKVDLMVAGFLGLNKVSGGLLGAGLGNIVGGLGKGFANVLLGLVAKVPVVGGAVGAVTATRVFVVNWPGGGFGGGVGAAAEGAAAGGGISAILGGFATTLVAIIPPILLAKAAIDKYNAINDNPGGPQAQLDADTKRALANPLVPLWLQGLFGDPKRPMGGLKGGHSLAPDERTPEMLDALDRSTTYLGLIVANTSMSAQHLGILAGVRVTGKVPSIAHLGAIGRSGDPFGFKHLKSFALGQINPKEMKPELLEHIADVNREIKRATEKGDTATVQKLQATKSGLEELLRQVRERTFHAGLNTYNALMAVVGAINVLPFNIAAALTIGGAGAAANMHWPKGSPYLGGGKIIPLASGGIVKRRQGGTLALLGEGAHDEAVVPMNGRGLTVDVHPAPVRLYLDSRELGYGILQQEAFTRRRAGG